MRSRKGGLPEGAGAGSSSRDPKPAIVRRLFLLFGLLFVAILFNAAYSLLNERSHLRQSLSKELESRLEIAASLKNSEIEKLEIISNIVRERNQVFSDYLDYNRISSIEAMLKTISNKYAVDLILLFDEDGNFVTANKAGPNIRKHSLYNMLISDRRERTGIEQIPAEIPPENLPETVGGPGAGRRLSIGSVVHVLHDTGEIYGYIVLLRFINNNRALVDKMAAVAKAEITFYDQEKNVILTSAAGRALPLPREAEAVVGSNDVSYIVRSAAIGDFSNRKIGWLAVAVDSEEFAGHWKRQIASALFPILISIVVSLALFIFLRLQVFERIKQLMLALHRVSGGQGDLSTRLPVPAEKADGAPLNEMDSLNADFNQMMDRLESMYGELRCAQREIEDANRELETRVRERTMQFERANENLVAEINAHKQAEDARQRLESQLLQAKKMEAIGTLAGGVAHDLNNVLSGVISYPELLLMHIPPDSPLRDKILSIKKSGEKAAAIVQDLLTLARRGVSITEVLDLNEIISEYLASPEHEKLALHHPQMRVETHLAQCLPKVLGSRVHLHKTIMNLVSNAAEAMPDGGISRISTESVRLEEPTKALNGLRPGEHVVLTVSDTGVGISPENIEKIFEPFFTKKKMGRSGTGLGLAVVWGTVKDHGGTIDVQSVEGRGTVFRISLPATRQASERGDTTTIRDLAGRGESILVVDDVPEQRDIAEKILGELGYAVVSVSSGEASLAYLRRYSADLILLDMILDPGIDGLETCRRILELRPEQRILTVSGFSENEHTKKAQELGVKGFVRKPYTLATIGKAVRRALE